MDELEIAGKRYLSTRRAAKDHKYTSDYVGQLIRGGKVVGKKVGRSWYVEEESLNAYLNGTSAPATASVEVQEKKVAEPKSVERLVEEPAVEIPVAAKIVEPVEVEEAPTLQTVEGRDLDQSVEEKSFEPVVVKTKTLEAHHIPIRTITPIEEKPATGLRYIADDEPTIPEIKRKTVVTTSPVRLTRTPAHAPEEEIELESAEEAPRRSVGAFAIVGVVIAGLATLSLTAMLSATLNSRIVVEKGQVASIGYTFQ